MAWMDRAGRCEWGSGASDNDDAEATEEGRNLGPQKRRESQGSGPGPGKARRHNESATKLADTEYLAG